MSYDFILEITVYAKYNSIITEALWEILTELPLFLPQEKKYIKKKILRKKIPQEKKYLRKKNSQKKSTSGKNLPQGEKTYVCACVWGGGDTSGKIKLAWLANTKSALANLAGYVS